MRLGENDSTVWLVGWMDGKEDGYHSQDNVVVVKSWLTFKVSFMFSRSYYALICGG